MLPRITTSFLGEVHAFKLQAARPTLTTTFNEESIVDERDVLRAWRELFQRGASPADNVKKAEKFLDGLSGESPLHLRLANELVDLKKLATPSKPKPKRAAR
jgi:hypothetical protein